MISLRRDKWPQTSTFPLQYYSTNLAIITVIRIPFTMTAYHDLETYFFNPQGKLIEVLSSLSVSYLLVSFMSLCSLPMSMSLELSKQVLFSNCDLSNSHLVPTATQNLISKQDELREALHRSFTCHPRYQKSHKPGPLHQWWTALYEPSYVLKQAGFCLCLSLFLHFDCMLTPHGQSLCEWGCWGIFFFW